MPLLLVDFLARVFLGATVLQWLIAAATLVGVYFALTLIRRLAVRRLGALAARTTTRWDDLAVGIAARTRSYFLFLIAVHAATRVVPLPPEMTTVLRVVSIIAVLFQAGVWGNGIIGFGAEHYLRMRPADDVGARTTIQAVGYAGRFVLWAVLLVTALDNFGIDVTGLVTGLGIGGIAIALAVQNILGDLFAALAIVLDKPFIVGDFIIVENVMGNVEHVGLKTTRIRSLSGEQIIISNNDLLKSRIRNYKRMEQRRIVFHIDVTYDTPPEKVARIPQIIRAAIERQLATRVDRCHFLTWAESALRIETVYFVLSSDYNKYADTQHAINLQLLADFQRESIEFAFATRTLYVKSDGQSPELNLT